jgi:hypothetical protein
MTSLTAAPYLFSSLQGFKSGKHSLFRDGMIKWFDQFYPFIVFQKCFVNRKKVIIRGLSRR